MVLLNVIRALFMGLFLYLCLGLAIHQWFWINYVVFTAAYFGCTTIADLADAWVIKWFNPEGEQDNVYRG